ncbi:hypothetical protein JTB14_027945 [Gonioctena quinquepunctata]|nr:hypothetical protein JTB14_027945 [Gonioctena quinquepunctata]
MEEKRIQEEQRQRRNKRRRNDGRKKKKRRRFVDKRGGYDGRKKNKRGVSSTKWVGRKIRVGGTVTEEREKATDRKNLLKNRRRNGNKRIYVLSIYSRKPRNHSLCHYDKHHRS